MMKSVGYWCALTFLLLGTISGCSSNSSTAATDSGGSQSGTVSMIVSDAPSDDWSTIGVKVLNISLVPQGGGAPVLVYTAPNPAPMINLVELDELSEILGNVTVPTGTYTRASLTLAANPGDVLLTASSSPEPGFEGTPGATVAASDIRIQGASGSAGNLTVPLSVNLVSPLVVTANQTNALDLEFDLSHPAFLVAHAPRGGGSTLWAINFNGPLRHHPIEDITRLVLRHLLGNVTAVAADGGSLTMTKQFPVVPTTNPETSIASSQSLSILADGTNGTIVYNVDAKSHSTLFNFSSVSGALAGKFVRVAARYQSNGTLVAVRVWFGSTFQSVWLSPEGHVLHVGASSVTVESENGTPVVLNVNSSTQFFFRAPDDILTGATPIGTGTAFLVNLKRGFKVHASVVDPLASPLVADTVDIEIARFDGPISAADTAGFTYTRAFADTADNYSKRLTFIGSNTKNGKDPLTGAQITGFKYWFFAFPTLVTSGSNAISNFISIANGSVNFGGSFGALTAYGQTRAVWNNPANPGDWSAPWVNVKPSPIPLGTVSAPWTTTGSGGSFTITVTGGANAVTVNASSVSGSAALVYQVDRNGNGVVTISPQDITTPAGLSNVASNLVGGTPVKIFGVPQTNGSVQAYVIFYYSGVMPAN